MDTHHPNRLLLWLLGGLVVGLTALMVTVAISNQPAPTLSGEPTEHATAPEDTPATSDDVDTLEKDTGHDLNDLEKDLKEIDDLDTSLDNEPEL